MREWKKGCEQESEGWPSRRDCGGGEAKGVDNTYPFYPAAGLLSILPSNTLESLGTSSSELLNVIKSSLPPPPRLDSSPPAFSLRPFSSGERSLGLDRSIEPVNSFAFRRGEAFARPECPFLAAEYGARFTFADLFTDVRGFAAQKTGELAACGLSRGALASLVPRGQLTFARLTLSGWRLRSEGIQFVHLFILRSNRLFRVLEVCLEIRMES